MIDGFYAIYFTGQVGVGMGMLILNDGVIAGADGAGVTYSGEYTIKKGEPTAQGEVRLVAPPGAMLVTGQYAGEQQLEIKFPITIPVHFDIETEFQVRLPTGPVNVAAKLIKRIGD